MNCRLRLLIAAVLVGTAISNCLAAAPSGVPGGNIGYNAAMAKLLADIPAFSAQVATSLTNLSDNSRMTIPMRMMKRQENLRIEVDFLKIKGAGAALQGLSALQNIGMSRMTSLVTPNDKTMMVLFPDLNAYTRVSLTEEDLQQSNFRVSKKSGGRETVNGQACVRQEVTLTGPGKQKVEATTWEAAALDKFPVRMFFRQPDGSMAMDYTGVELTAPAADLFQVPPGYRVFDSMSALMQDAMTRVLPPGPGGKSR